MNKFAQATFKEGNYLSKEVILPDDGLRQKLRKRVLNILKGAVDFIAIPVKFTGREVRSAVLNIMNTVSEPFETGIAYEAKHQQEKQAALQAQVAQAQQAQPQ